MVIMRARFAKNILNVHTYPSTYLRSRVRLAALALARSRVILCSCAIQMILFCLSTLIYLGRSGQFVRLKGAKLYFTCYYFDFCTFAQASKMLLRISYARGREDSSTDSCVKDNITVP